MSGIERHRRGRPPAGQVRRAAGRLRGRPVRQPGHRCGIALGPGQRPGAHLDVPMLGATLGIAALQTSEYFGGGRDPCAWARPIRATRRTASSAAATISSAWPRATTRCGAASATCSPERTCWTTSASPPLRHGPGTGRAARDPRAGVRASRHPLAGSIPRRRRALRAINTYSQVLADPQVEHMQWVQPLELPNGVRTRTFASPMRFSGEGLPVRLRPPALGEHNDEVLGPLRSGRGAAQ